MSVTKLGKKLTNDSNSTMVERGTILTNVLQKRPQPKGMQLTTDMRSTAKFKLSIEHMLANNYQFKNMKQDGLKSFSGFLMSTVCKDLSITEVEKLYLRTKGKPGTTEIVNGKEREVYHFGRDRSTFRIFGYYNDDSYFVIYRIDPKHKYNRMN